MMEHKIITAIKSSELLPKIPDSFGKILKIPIDSYNYDMDACAIELSKYPQLEAALIRILNIISKLNRNIITIKDAIIYLGTKNTRLIAISFITRLLLPDRLGRTLIFD